MANMVQAGRSPGWDRDTRSFVVGLALLCLAIASPPVCRAAAQGPSGKARELPVGWHEVQPGETLSGITARYLGDSALWRENWQLNPDVKDPNLLVPGQRLRVLGALPPGTAEVVKLKHTVEKKPEPKAPWELASPRDILGEKAAVQTHEKASTELRFEDDARLVVTENSLIFLREVRKTPQVYRDLIEIQQGQADLLESRGGVRVASTRDIEIVIGQAQARPRLGGSEPAQTRARRADQGSAQVMVYGGATAVAAAGAQVEVPRGMGTSVPEGGPPAPPEKLLPPPQLAKPADGSSWQFANPPFRWRPVDGARSYTLEVCSDPACGRLVDRVVGLDRTAWAPAGNQLITAGSPPPQQLHWRVTAVSASGLDGFPAEPAAFALQSDRPDTAPPRGEIRVVGPQVGVADQLFVAPTVKLEATVIDELSGVQSWTRLLNGDTVTENGWNGPWQAGTYTAQVVAVDQVGNRGTIELVFTVDTEAPEVLWESFDSDRLDPGRRSRSKQRKELEKLKKEARARGLDLLWSSDGRHWLPLETRDQLIKADLPQLLLRAVDGTLTVADSTRLPADHHLRVWAEDAGCGVKDLEFSLRPEAPHRYTLLVEGGDYVGNLIEYSLVVAVEGAGRRRR